MKFAVTVVSPPGYQHSAAFYEIAEALHYGLTELGFDSVVTTEGDIEGHQHIVLGANLLPYFSMPLAADAILYNLEQVQDCSVWISAEQLELFRRHPVWDYSASNASQLEAAGIPVARVVPIGYVKELTRIAHQSEPDIDVLFFGSLNARRQQVLDELKAAGLRVVALFGVYSWERDAYIARAKLVINVHFYDTKVLEMVRLAYLLANRCAVLSEHSASRQDDEALAGAVAFADYGALARRAHELIDAPEERDELARRGFELMSARPMADYLHAALSRGH